MGNDKKKDKRYIKLTVDGEYINTKVENMYTDELLTCVDIIIKGVVNAMMRSNPKCRNMTFNEVRVLILADMLAHPSE